MTPTSPTQLALTRTQEDDKQAKAMAQQARALEDVKRSLQGLSTGLGAVQTSVMALHAQQDGVRQSPQYDPDMTLVALIALIVL